jgi:hypothetical protein
MQIFLLPLMLLLLLLFAVIMLRLPAAAKATWPSSNCSF